MRKRNHRHRRQGWLHWLKRFWKNLVRAIKGFILGDRYFEHSSRSPYDERDEPDEQFDQPIQDLADRPSNPLNNQIAISRPTPFLLGLDNLANLEFLTTKEFLAEIKWNVENPQVLPVKEEDLTLLDDLLMNFPDA